MLCVCVCVSDNANVNKILSLVQFIPYLGGSIASCGSFGVIFRSFFSPITRQPVVTDFGNVPVHQACIFVWRIAITITHSRNLDNPIMCLICQKVTQLTVTSYPLSSCILSPVFLFMAVRRSSRGLSHVISERYDWPVAHISGQTRRTPSSGKAWNTVIATPMSAFYSHYSARRGQTGKNIVWGFFGRRKYGRNASYERYERMVESTPRSKRVHNAITCLPYCLALFARHF